PPNPTGAAGPPGEARERLHPAGHAGADRLVLRAHRRGGLGPGADAHQPGLRAPRAAHGPALPADEAVRLGGGQPEHALEPGAVPGGGLPVRRAFSAERTGHGAAAVGLLERPLAQARVPLLAQAWLVAQSGGAVLQRPGAAVPEARRLRLG